MSSIAKPLSKVGDDILPLAPVVAKPPATIVIPSVPPTVNTSPPA